MQNFCKICPNFANFANPNPLTLRNAENPVLRLLHGESERVKELQSEAAKADGGSDENSSGGSDKHSSKHGAPAIDGIFKDPIQAADEVGNLGCAFPEPMLMRGGQP